MTEPAVVAVMLTRNRPLMALRALKAFRRQSYTNKQLLVWDSSRQEPLPLDIGYLMGEHHVAAVLSLPSPEKSIGELRNDANAYIERYRLGNIVMHWDDDDWSHPARMEEQVELLMRNADVEAVGYRDMLFWAAIARVTAGIEVTRSGAFDPPGAPAPPPYREYVPGPELVSEEAWIYSHGNPHFCVGTSLCYWLKTWNRKPFPSSSNGEDTQWLAGLQSLGVTMLGGDGPSARHIRPRMIAAVHGHNTTTMMNVAMRVGTPELKRTPQWDEYCRREMAL